MAKTSMIVKNNKRKKLVAEFRARRDELRRRSLDVKLSDEERDEARRLLGKLPKNSNPIRIQNRCSLTGRPRGYLRKFGLSRISMRELALHGELPGVRKASW